MKTAAIEAPARHGWDRLGVWASAGCTIHCLIAPFLFLAIPKFASIWAHPASHALVALFVIPLACTVLIRGYRLHRRRWVAAATVIGMIFILAGTVLPYIGQDAPTPSASGTVAQSADDHVTCTSCCPRVEAAEDGSQHLVIPRASIATIIGSIFLVAAHIGNMAACRCHGNAA